MLSEAFYWIANMSVIGSATGLLVLAAGRIRRLPRGAVYAAWIIPLIRLWLPFGIPTRYSLLNLLSRFTTRTVPVYDGNTLPELVITNYIMAAREYRPFAFKTPALGLTFRIAAILWIAGSVALAAAVLLAYLRARSAARSAVRLHDNVYRTGSAGSPSVFGILRPKILIPPGLTGADLTPVLLHENAHIARKDNLFRLAAILTACLHWFNPLVWIFLKRFFEDMELACDARVLRRMDAGERKKYASSLLDFYTGAAHGNGNSLFASAFGGAGIRTRIVHILSYRSLGLLSGIACAVLLVAVAAALLTNAQIG